MQSISLNVRELFEATQSVIGRRRKRKALPVILAAKAGRFGIADAKYRATTAEIHCIGRWIGTAEVDGVQFRKILNTITDKESINILKNSSYIVIKGDTFTINLKRLDPLNKNKTKRAPLPHKGKVEHQPDPTTKRVEYYDMWDFSARVPMPK